jgi:hypothetical protein
LLLLANFSFQGAPGLHLPWWVQMLRMRRRLNHEMHAGKKGPFYTRREAVGQP